ncbi:MAG: UDP-N-acetylmuramoyl-tripeptide--D-alanyl-D-alanine ligase [Bdellovibrionota bacterium]
MVTKETFYPRLNPDFVARSLGLTVPVLSRPFVPFTSVTTDSRKIREGCLFVALRGEKFDGHDFIETAVQQGARGVICRRGFQLQSYKNLCVFPVEDTQAAYRKIAAAWRREFSIPVIVVAGSVGKTTTKEILAAILQGRYPKVLKTQGSQNGFVGIPMTLLELTPEHGAAVIEVGIDEIGAMHQHMALVAGTASVLTAIGPEHLEKLKDLPTVAREEGYALSAVAQSGGKIFVNLDDPWIRPHYSILRVANKVAYTLQSANVTGPALQGKLSEDGRSIKVSGLGLADLDVPMPLLGAHNAMNLLAAVAIAAGLGLTGEEILTGLRTFQVAFGRSDLRQLPGPTPVLCDYYNANPSSMAAGLDLLNQVWAKNGTRWACLADMLELGEEEEKFHRELAGKLIELGIEHVLLYGPRMQALQQELQTRGFQGKTEHYANQSELASALVTGVKPGDAILIKGSRGMRMEEVWKVLEPHAQSHWSH